MTNEFDIWRLAAGLGLFLFGMTALEKSLQQLAGRSFKRFLREYTEKPISGMFAGALSTAALQSSSVVSLIVLAFVGTGIISLSSAISIVFGSNFGTTATGWIVATLGFKLDIESLALPLIAFGSFGIVWSANGSRRSGFSYLIAGFGLMLLGLEFMKSGALAATGLFNPEALAGYPLIVFLLAGLLITAAIQSSSATIMITLSALYAGVLTLESAAAIAIGADLGTTITAMLGSMVGSIDKKRVAVASVIFNLTSDTVAFILLHPLLYVVTVLLGISDPLFALVAFHSLFNLIGVTLFLPFVGVLSGWLSRRFTEDETAPARHIKPEISDVADVAIENADKETLRLIDQAAALNQLGLHLRPAHAFYESDSDRRAVRVFRQDADYETCYAELKHLEGEILAYVLSLQEHALDPDDSARISQIIPAIRNGVHSAKNIKDIRQDLESFRGAVNDRFNAYYRAFSDVVREFYGSLETLASADLPALRFERLARIRKTCEALHERLHRQIYDEIAAGELSRIEISTLLNVNREIYLSNLSLVAALADALLDIASAEDFAALPPLS